MPDKENRVVYWLRRALRGSVSTRTRLERGSGESAVRMGRRPISSGIKPYCCRSRGVVRSSVLCVGGSSRAVWSSVVEDDDVCCVDIGGAGE